MHPLIKTMAICGILPMPSPSDYFSAHWLYYWHDQLSKSVSGVCKVTVSGYAKLHTFLLACHPGLDPGSMSRHKLLDTTDRFRLDGQHR